MLKKTLTVIMYLTCAVSVAIGLCGMFFAETAWFGKMIFPYGVSAMGMFVASALATGALSRNDPTPVTITANAQTVADDGFWIDIFVYGIPILAVFALVDGFVYVLLTKPGALCEFVRQIGCACGGK